MPLFELLVRIVLALDEVAKYYKEEVFMFSLMGILLVLVALGLILWVILTYIPMPPFMKNIICAVTIIFVILWLLQLTGLWPAVSDIRIHR